MGEVYRADDLKLGQPVALKFLPRGLAEVPARLDLHAEVRIARQVSHPSAAASTTSARSRGSTTSPWSSWTGKISPRSRSASAGFPPTRRSTSRASSARVWRRRTTRAVLHRDLKPANVMVDGRGGARITDFGLAIAAGEVVEGEVSGTPAYMAPSRGQGCGLGSDTPRAWACALRALHGKEGLRGSEFSGVEAGSMTEAPVSPSTVARVRSGRRAGDPCVASRRIRPGARPRCPRWPRRFRRRSSRRRSRRGDAFARDGLVAAGEEGALAPGRAWALLGAALV